MKQSLLAALQEPGNLSVRFQPVFELVDRPNPIHALEAAIGGPEGTHFEDRSFLLEYVRRKKAEPLIDRDVVTAVCRVAEALPANVRIHLPVHTSTLAQNPGFASHLQLQAQNRGLALERLTIELMENDLAPEVTPIANAIGELRKMGVRVGVSGVGLGNSAWRLLVEESPEYWKLAPYLVQGMSGDFKKRIAIEAILELGKRFGSCIVAAGIKNPEDLAELAMLGVQYVQADFLCPAISVDALLRSDALNEAVSADDDDCTTGMGPVFAQ